jgi:DNA polymerase delta subunit 1
MRENLYGFQGNRKVYYLKITVTEPRWIGKLRSTLEAKFADVNYKRLFDVTEHGILTFDNIQYVLRFMIDTGVRKPYICPNDDFHFS